VKLQRAAVAHYLSPISTNENELRGNFKGRSGRFIIFFRLMKKVKFVEHIKELTEFGFPITE
jgi:hypothetical protein